MYKKMCHHLIKAFVPGRAKSVESGDGDGWDTTALLRCLLKAATGKQL